MPRLIPRRDARANPLTPDAPAAPDGPATPAAPAGSAERAAQAEPSPPPYPAGLGVPALAHPLVAPAEWAELARPGTPLDWAAFDVARGPGSRADPLYGQALTRVRENGVPILGLLDCAYGRRPFGELVRDASHHLDWYRVDGFYLDRAPTLAADTADCRRLAATLRALLVQEHDRDPVRTRPRGSVTGPPAPRLVLAPGAYPHPAYAEIADQLVVFDGPWTRYRWSEAPQWSAGYPARRFAHLVHGLPAAHLDAALRIARWQGAGTLCMTDRTGRGGPDEDAWEAGAWGGPWAGLPGYWPDLVRRVREEPGGGVPGPAGAAPSM